MNMKRRTFLSTAALASTAHAIEPFSRGAAKFSGLGLTTYSLKRHMKWWWGKPNKDVGGQQLEMADFLDLRRTRPRRRGNHELLFSRTA